MTGVRDHAELEVWQLCDDLRVRVRSVVDRPAFASYETLRSQLRESSERPCPNIAEGFARYLPRDNARFVRIAAGSLAETTDHLGRARACRLITAQEESELVSLARRARKAANGYIIYLQSAEAPHLPKLRRNRNGNPREPEP
jgi:four helix bundle protein